MYEEIKINFTNGTHTHAIVSEDENPQDIIVEICEVEGWDIDEVEGWEFTQTVFADEE